MSEKIRIGLIGAGKFGGYHANKLSEHSRVEFTGVFDVSEQAASALGARQNIEVFSHIDSLIDGSEGLVIAAPASYHGDYALMALSKGKHLLIEKPMALDLAQAKQIKSLAAQKKRVVQIGHQERFVGRAIGLDKIPERPILIKAQRLNPYSTRGTDASVTMDLMTHDIDLVNWLMGTKAVVIGAAGRKARSDKLDHVAAELAFADTKVFLEASRVAEQGHRSLDITYPSGTVSIDLNAKTLVHNTPFALNKDFGDHPDARDSLGAGTSEFVSAICENRTPFISAGDGLKAVQIALDIDGKI